MKTKIFALIVLVAAGFSSIKANDSEKGIKVAAGADVVSSYVWRGGYCAGASFQPYANASIGGFTLGAWGSTDFIGTSKELDFYLAYETGGFSVMVTDYFGAYSTIGGKAIDGVNFIDYFKTGHSLEGTIGYGFDFGLSLAWNTVFLGDEDYSSYIDLGYEFDVKNVDCAIGVGISPWGGWYSEKFHVANISFTATKEVSITDDYALGIFTQAVWSPSYNDAHLIVGISF